MKQTARLVALYAALLLVAGAALLFMPEAVFPDAAPPMLAQLVGAALLGFALANWTARNGPLGGIYGRAVVVGNQAFAFIGLLVLLKNLPTEKSLAFWFLLGVLAYGAVLFTVLMYRAPRFANAPPD